MHNFLQEPDQGSISFQYVTTLNTTEVFPFT